MYKTSAFNTRGFTLIELMVVMVILSILGSLVGPNLLKAFDRQKINTERELFKKQVEQASVIAFSQVSPISVTLQGKSYKIKKAEQVVLAVDTEYLFFPEQRLEISKTGVLNLSEVKFITADTPNGYVDLSSSSFLSQR